MRIRLALAALAAAMVVAAVVAVTVGTGPEPPATGAAAVVPADVLAYVHVSTDPSRSEVRQALGVGARLPTFPLLAAGVIARVSALVGGGTRVDFERDIRPWLGREAALALLNTSGSSAGSELVLDVARMARARAFLTHAGASLAGTYRGTTLYRYRSGAELALVRHYLVVGQGASVRAALDAASGGEPSLQASLDYQRAAAGEPAGRVLDAYVSPDGVQRLLMPRGGLIGAAGALLYQPQLAGATISVSASGTGVRLHVHSALEGRADALQPFTPTLQEVLPAGTLLALDVRGLQKIAPHLLDAAATAGIGGRIAPLLRHLGAALAAQGVDVGRIESLFSGETAVAIGPGSSGQRSSKVRSPALMVVTRTSNEQAAIAELANLEVPLSQLFPAPSSGSGEVPQLADRVVDGIAAHQVVLAPGLELDYAVFRGLVVISTGLQGIGAVAGRVRELASDPSYRATLSGRPGQVTSLVFLDLSQLLNLVERTGLLRGTRYRTYRPDIERIRAIGLDSTRGEADSTAELTLQIP
jgi:hypothetical protein